MAVVHFTDDRINESSGLGASRLNPINWTINDEPSTPNVFGVSRSSGATVSTVTWKGDAGLIDPEAIKIDTSNRMWHCDFGDNPPAGRDYIRLLMAPEPKTLGNHTNVAFSKYLLLFPDGPHNCEAFAPKPKTSDRFLVTKEATSRMYKLSPLKGNNAMNKLIKLDHTFGAYVSDSEFSPDGRWFMTLRQDELLKAWIYDVEDDFSLADTLTLGNHGQTKIEGITFDPNDGKSFWVSSEGEGAPMFSTALDSDFWPAAPSAPVPVACP